jgi:hypothetical protein
MAGEKAKENKTLVATCAGCGKTLSTELLYGIVTGRGRVRTVVGVCQACRDQGWTPSATDAPHPG